MKTLIAFVLLFSLRTISLAADVTVYDSSKYYYTDPQQKRDPVTVSQFPWKFDIGYVRSDVFNMDVCITNKSSSVTTINAIYQLDNRTFKMQKYTQQTGQKKGEEYYNLHFNRSLKFTEMKIIINLYKSNVLCSSVIVAKGRDAVNKTMNKEFQHYDICFRKYKYCVLLVDLKNKCDGPPLVIEKKTKTTTKNTAVIDVGSINPNNTLTFNSSTNLEITTHKNSTIDTKNSKQESSKNNVLIYVIPSVVGMCVIILLIYLISVKRYCRRNSNPVETLELNTYSTANEVVYADLGFVHGDSQPPGRGEESPYAQIVGVLKPAD